MISPVAGSLRPIRWRSSVLLPHPLPPMMMKMSPRFDHEIEIAHQDEAAIGHRQVAHDDMRLRAGAIFAVACSHREVRA